MSQFCCTSKSKQPVPSACTVRAGRKKKSPSLVSKRLRVLATSLAAAWPLQRQHGLPRHDGALVQRAAVANHQPALGFTGIAQAHFLSEFRRGGLAR